VWKNKHKEKLNKSETELTRGGTKVMPSFFAGNVSAITNST
jgi:hypothetical protein